MAKGLGLREMAVGRKDVFLVPPHLLNEEENFNARKEYTGIEEFADFIRENGVLALPPLYVYRKGDKWYISDGHRRIRAVRIVESEGIDVRGVPCMNDPLNEEDRTLALVTRNSGTPLTKMEQGDVFQRMVNFGYTNTEIAKKIGKSLPYVGQCLALATAPKKVQELLIAGVVNDTTVLTALGSVEDVSMAYEVIMDGVEAAKNTVVVNGNGGNGDVPNVTQRDVSRAVRTRVGKETVSTRMKNLGEWIEEQSLMLKDNARYDAIKDVYSFLRGEITVDDLVK